MGDSNNNIAQHKELLWYAVNQGDLPRIQEALDGGVSINVEYSDGTTPLHMACQACHLEAVKLLVQKGANVRALDDFQRTPCRCAFAEHGSGFAPKVCLDIAKFLIENGAEAEINAAMSDHGWTLMHYSCSTLLGGRLEHMKFFLERGAEIDAKDNVGKTPLYLACLHSRFAEAKFLIDSGANVNATEKEHGKALMHLVCGLNRLHLVKLLRENGAEINIKRDNGATPLHDACRESYLELIQFLLNQGADVTAKTEAGFTALQVACRDNKADVVWLLVRQRYPCLFCDMEESSPSEPNANPKRIKLDRS